jgi:KDO2-lipid IV(A) lauroyltransferase
MPHDPRLVPPDSSAERDESDGTNPFDWRFLGPVYWGIWGIVGLLWLLAYAPHPLRRAAAVLLGGMYRRGYPKRKRIVERNLALCFPEESVATREDWLRRHFILQAFALLDLGRLWFRSPAYLKAHTRVSHPDIFARLVANGGVVLTG